MQARKSPLARNLFRSLLVVLLLGWAADAGAEERIAYANMKLILSLMPEMKSVMGRLESFQKELSQQLDVAVVPRGLAVGQDHLLVELAQVRHQRKISRASCRARRRASTSPWVL